MNSDNPVDAVASFRRAVALRPRHAAGNRLLGVCLQKLGRAKEALPHLETAIDEAPDNADARNDLGLTLIDLDRMEDAAASFRAAIQLDAEHAKAHFNLGIYHARRNEFEVAVELIEAAARIRPEYVQAWSALGRIYSLQSKPVESAEALKHAIGLHGSDPDIVLLYGKSLIEAGRPEEARALLPKLRTLNAARAASLEQLLGP